MSKVTPCLWFDDQAEDAARFYTSLIKNSKVGAIARYGDVGPGPKGSVMTVMFTLDGHEYMGLNGGPHFKHTEAFSLIVNCDSQKEVDMLWEKFSEGGEKSQCGWVKDKYGVSWQITPRIMEKLMSGANPARSQRVMKAMLQMTKLDIKTLQKAYDGK